MTEAWRATSPQLWLALTLFRVNHRLRRSRRSIPRFVNRGCVALYRFVSLSLVGMDIPSSTSMSPSVRVYHGVGLVVHDRSRIEAEVELRQNTTIGSKTPNGPAPWIQRGASLGANVVVLGGVTIGANAVIGAGSVVVTDVPADAVFAGNPARRLR